MADRLSLKNWLSDRGSLTQRLSAAGEFSMALLTQRLALPTRDEAHALGQTPGRLVWVREVTLFCNNRPVVFAHSVLPRLPRGPLTRGLMHLGRCPLGALLFSHPGFRRGRLAAQRLDRRHALFSRAIEALQLRDKPPAVLWSRRSGFSFKTQTLLVTEIFSPEILRIRF